MTDGTSLHLFEAYGVELEYAIVDARSLAVLPVCDEVIRAVAGDYLSEIEQGAISWSNELALHVVELKTSGPAPRLAPLPREFQEQIARIDDLLSQRGGRLMPSAMHPWMEPAREMRLWPHGYSPVYEAFDRIFDCRGHGWANLQSVHLNLPFAGDEEFARLHAAVRLVLPLLPALAASSPVVEGELTGLMDTRLEVYRSNARRIPSVTGEVVPEPIFSRDAYEREILGRIYADIGPHDPAGVLRHEWLNARGAIARFERDTIEIRVLDVQECPRADVAICAAVVAVLQALVAERWTSTARQRAFDTAPLAALLRATARDAEQARIDDPAYLAQFGLADGPHTAGDVWRHLIETLGVLDADGGLWREPLEVILRQGPLARRIAAQLSEDATPDRQRRVYRGLCECLAAGRMFEAP